MMTKGKDRNAQNDSLPGSAAAGSGRKDNHQTRSPKKGGSKAPKKNGSGELRTGSWVLFHERVIVGQLNQATFDMPAVVTAAHYLMDDVMVLDLWVFGTHSITRIHGAKEGEASGQWSRMN